MIAPLTEWGRHVSIMGAAWYGSLKATPMLADANAAIEEITFIPNGGFGIVSILIMALFGAYQYEYKKGRSREKELIEHNKEEITRLKADHMVEKARLEESRSQAWQTTEKARAERNQALAKCINCPGNEARRNKIDQTK